MLGLLLPAPDASPIIPVNAGCSPSHAVPLRGSIQPIWGDAIPGELRLGRQSVGSQVMTSRTIGGCCLYAGLRLNFRRLKTKFPITISPCRCLLGCYWYFSQLLWRMRIFPRSSPTFYLFSPMTTRRKQSALMAQKLTKHQTWIASRRTERPSAIRFVRIPFVVLRERAF